MVFPSEAEVTPTSPTTCLITAQSFFTGTIDAGSGVLSVGISVNGGAPLINSFFFGWVKAVASSSHYAQATWSWNLAAGATYRFGCAFYASGDYVGKAVLCEVHWVCR